MRDIISEITKIYRYVSENSPAGIGDYLEIRILSENAENRYIQKKLREIQEYVSKRIKSESLDIKYEKVSEPINLLDLQRVGIQKEKAKDIRVVILSDETNGGNEMEIDKKILYQLQLIENKVSDEIFTVVELSRYDNYQLFKNLRADVILCPEDFTAKLLAQATLKPYVSLIFRNLLTFSKDTNEIYIREVPSSFVGKRIMDLQRALTRYPVIFIGYIRSCQKEGDATDDKLRRSRITINPRVRPKYIENAPYGRITKTDLIQEGDRIILIAREPKIVDNILYSLSNN